MTHRIRLILLMMTLLGSVAPLLAESLGPKDLSRILQAYTENELRFRRDFSGKSIELQATFSQLQPTGADWNLLASSEGALVGCRLSESAAMAFVEARTGAPLALKGQIVSVQRNSPEEGINWLELKQCQVKNLGQNVVQFDLKGRWKGCNLRIGTQKYNGKICSLYLTIEDRMGQLQLSDVRRSDGRPIRVETADAVGGILSDWSTRTMQTNEITQYRCEFAEQQPNEFQCEWQESRREGTIRFERIR